MKKLIVIAGAGEYPRLLVEGAKRAGVETVDVMAVKGSCERATARAADHVFPFAVGESEVAIRWTAEHGYDGAVLAGQVSPLSLFRGKFGPVVRQWLAEMPVKNAHTIFGKLVSEFEKAGVRMIPASSFMEDSMPGVGVLTARGFSEVEKTDAARGFQVAADVGRHDVGQTVLVKSGMVLAVEAFEGTNAAIRWRFDIPVVGLKTLKTMKKAGVTALAFQAHRLLLLDRGKVVDFANRNGIAIAGFESGLPPAPTRP